MSAVTKNALDNMTRKSLAEIAKQRGVSGWHSMRKAELLKSLNRLSLARKNSKKKRQTNGTNGKSSLANSLSLSKTICQRIQQEAAINHQMKNISTEEFCGPVDRDRLLVIERKAYWIEIEWQIAHKSVERARAALGSQWHHAYPAIRLFDVTADDLDHPANEHVADIPVSGEVDSWHVQVPSAEMSCKLEIGYLTPAGKFFSIARTTKIAPFRKNMTRPLISNGNGKPNGSSNGTNGNRPAQKQKKRTHSLRTSYLTDTFEHNGDEQAAGNLKFELDAELVLSGITEPGAEVLLHGDTIPLRADGSFSIQVPLQEGRQVMPAVAVKHNGLEQCTIILAVERNTKKLEPQVFSSEY